METARQLREVRTKLGYAIEEGRRIGEKIRRNPLGAASLEESYQRVLGDVEQLTLRVKHYEQEQQLPAPLRCADVGSMGAEHHALHSSAFTT